MEFKTERLILRPWKETDAESLYQYAKDPAVGPIAGWPVHTSVENSREIIKNILSAPETYAVCLKEDNRAIGSIGLLSPMQSHTAAGFDEMEIGFWIGAPFWGYGYIPEAVHEMLRYAFEELGLKAMWSGYFEGNEKSRRCQEKCGFTYHHTEKEIPWALMGDIRTEHFTYLTKETWVERTAGTVAKKTIILYIHGQGGSATEADHYMPLFPEYDVYGLDYRACTPWETRIEIKEAITSLKKKYENIILIANSIGAYFSMNAGIDVDVSRAYFISPIVNMEELIRDKMSEANVGEEELQKKGSIHTISGETLSWEYLSYVRDRPVCWQVKTDVLYGSADHLTSIDTVTEFAKKHKADLTIMDGGEHWFHTSQQMAFLDQWMKKVSSV